MYLSGPSIRNAGGAVRFQIRARYQQSTSGLRMIPMGMAMWARACIYVCSGGYRGGVGGVRTPPSDLMMNKIKD